MFSISASLFCFAVPFAARAADEPPVVTARAEGGAVFATGGVRPAGGVAGGIALPFGGVSAELEAAAGLEGALAPRVDGLVGARIAIGPDLTLSLAGGGGWRSGGPVPIGRLGVAYDLLLRRMPLRFSAYGEASPMGAGLLLGVGAAIPMAPRTPVVVEEPEEPRPPEGPLEVNAPNALVWVPHPVCAWVPPEEADRLLALVDPEVPAQIHAPGYLPAEVPRDGSRSVTLQAAPPVGAVVIVAFPGDEVRVDGVAFPLAPDGTAVFSAPEGTVNVAITGAGRSVQLEGAVAAGYALWLRASTPAPLVLAFAPGSAALPPDASDRLTAFAALAGDHGFRVVGSYSGEVDLGESRHLADQRAEALKTALIAAGVPATAINVLSTATPEPRLAPDALRVARVEPILPKEVR